MVFLNDTDLRVEYQSAFYNAEEANVLFNELLRHPFKPVTFQMGLKTFTPLRKICTYSDPGIYYSFSGVNVPGEPWSDTTYKIKQKVEAATGHTYNYVLLNLYPDGRAKIAPHQDAEAEIDKGVPIPAVSFGASRRMLFTRQEFASKVLVLESGSLMVMHPPTNHHWKHSILQEANVLAPRISLTFRKFTNGSSFKENNNTEPIPEKVWLNLSKSSDEPPACKRLKEENLIPDYDWLTHYLTSQPECFVQPQFNEEVFYTKNLGWSLQLKLAMTSVGPRTQMLPINTGSSRDFQVAVSLDSPTLYEFLNKLEHLKISDRSTGFVANSKVLACAIHRDKLLLQNVTFSSPGFSLSKLCVEVYEEDLELLKEEIEHVSELLFDILFSKFLPIVVNKHSKVFQPGPSVGRLDTLDATNLFNIILKQFLSECIHTYYRCEGCQSNDSLHTCTTFTIQEKFNSLSPKVLLCFNVVGFSKHVFENIHESDLAPDIFNTVTLERCELLNTSV